MTAAAPANTIRYEVVNADAPLSPAALRAIARLLVDGMPERREREVPMHDRDGGKQ